MRGKKTKAAKAKAKYADQDEEDRELAMQFLASAGKSCVMAACVRLPFRFCYHGKLYNARPVYVSLVDHELSKLVLLHSASPGVIS